MLRLARSSLVQGTGRENLQTESCLGLHRSLMRLVVGLREVVEGKEVCHATLRVAWLNNYS